MPLRFRPLPIAGFLVVAACGGPAKPSDPARATSVVVPSAVQAASRAPVTKKPVRAHVGGGPHLSAGSDHTCAVLRTGAVKCWGFGTFGELGRGAARSVGGAPKDVGLPIVDLGNRRTAIAVSGGALHTCALLDTGAVKCWGHSVFGQLGLGDKEPRGDDPKGMGDNLPAVDLGTGRTAVAVSAGGTQTCAVLDTGALKCWGYGPDGQLGLGDTNARGDDPKEMGDALPAVDLGTRRTAVAVSAGTHHTCAILDTGAVKCWGLGADGQLGLGDTKSRGAGPNEMGDALPAVDLGTGRTVVAVSAGAFHTCAILDTGAVKCWGNGYFGVLGRGSKDVRGAGPNEMGDALPAVDLGTGRTAVGLSVGAHHTCVVLDTAVVKCWGHGAAGRLGLGDRKSRGAGPNDMGDALPSVDLGTEQTAVAVGSGEFHTCAVLATGAVKCWGLGDDGRLGLGDASSHGDAPDQMGEALPAVDLGGRVGP